MVADKAKANKDLEAARVATERQLTEIIKQTVTAQAEIVQVRTTYSEKRKHLVALEEKIAVYDERLAFAELGVYEPHFDFGDSKDYKDAITAIRALQKDYVSKKTATISPTDWTVDGSKSNGQTMISRQSRLAEMTKSGYVYIISSIGSFGEDVVKIGPDPRSAAG